MPHICDALNVSFHNYVLLKEQLSSEIYRNFTMKDIVSQYGMSTALCKKVDLPPDLAKEYFAFQMRADGNCGFNSLSFCIILNTAYGKVFRRSAFLEVSFSKKLLEKLSFLNDYDNADMFERLTTDNSYINECILQVLTSVLSRDIIVFAKTNGGNLVKTWYKNDTPRNLSPLCIYLEQSHYVPLIKLNSNVMDPQVGLQNILPEFRSKEISNLRKQDLLHKFYQYKRPSVQNVVDLELESRLSDSSNDVEILSTGSWDVDIDPPLTASAVFSTDGPNVASSGDLTLSHVFGKANDTTAEVYNQSQYFHSELNTTVKEIIVIESKTTHHEDDNSSLLSIDSLDFKWADEIPDRCIVNDEEIHPCATKPETISIPDEVEILSTGSWDVDIDPPLTASAVFSTDRQSVASSGEVTLLHTFVKTNYSTEEFRNESHFNGELNTTVKEIFVIYSKTTKHEDDNSSLLSINSLDLKSAEEI